MFDDFDMKDKFCKECGKKFNVGDLIKYKRDLDSNFYNIGKICAIKGPYPSSLNSYFYKIYIFNEFNTYIDTINLILDKRGNINSGYDPTLVEKFNCSKDYLIDLIDALIKEEMNKLEHNTDDSDFEKRINHIESLSKLYLDYLQTVIDDRLELKFIICELIYKIHMQARHKLADLHLKEDTDEIKNIKDSDLFINFKKKLYNNLKFLYSTEETREHRILNLGF